MEAKIWPRLGAAAMACALVACGGGGGGSSGGTSGGLSVKSDVSAIAIAGVNGSRPQGGVIHFTMTGGAGTYYGAAVSDHDGFVADFEPTSDTTATVSLTAVNPVAPGTATTGNVTFQLCTDAACQQVVWKQTFPYTMTEFALDTNGLSIQGSEGATAPAVPVAVTPPDVGHLLTATSTCPSFLAVDLADPASIGVTASAKALGAGSYPCYITLGVEQSGVDGQDLASIAVSFNVGSGIVAPAVSPIDFLARTTAANLSGRSNVAFAGGQAAAWTAASDQPWLVLDTSQGVGAGAIAWHVDVSKFDAVQDWTTATANVWIQASGLAGVGFPISVDKKLPEIAIATPNGLLSGAPRAVQVTGRGLSQLAGIGGITIDGHAAASGSIVSDTAAMLQLTGLAAGAHVVAVSNVAGARAATAAIGVRDANALAAASVPYAGRMRAALFDPMRNAVFATDAAHNVLVRYALVGGAWQVTTLPVASIGSLALSPDAATVYVASDRSLVAVDPDTMTVRQAYAAPVDFGLIDGFSGGLYFTHALAVTSDLRLWLAGPTPGELTYFDLRGSDFGRVSAVDASGQDLQYDPDVFAPADGSSLMVETTRASPAPPALRYDPATATFASQAAAPLTYDLAFDAHGTVVLNDDQTLRRTGDYSLLGNVVVDTAGGTRLGSAAIVSPDGRRVYRESVDTTNNRLVVDHLEAFDATQVASGTSNLVDLGPIALPVKAPSCSDPAVYLCDWKGLLVADPTGTTLFWVGGANLVVVPLPSSLSGVSASVRPQDAGRGRLRKARL